MRKKALGIIILIIAVLTFVSMIGVNNFKKEKQEEEIKKVQEQEERKEKLTKEKNKETMLENAGLGLLTESKVDAAVEDDRINEEDAEIIKDKIRRYEETEKEKEEQKALQKAEEEKENTDESYETGITYENIARNPETYKNKKVNFTGKVVQVLEGKYTTTIRLAVNDDYDKVIIAKINSDLLYNNRILEKDIINIKGFSCGMFTYESTLGAQISAPGVEVDRFIIKN